MIFTFTGLGTNISYFVLLIPQWQYIFEVSKIEDFGTTHNSRINSIPTLKLYSILPSLGKSVILK